MLELDIMTPLTSYKTSLLSERQATSFGAMIRANRRFADVRVCHSARAKGPNAWYVTFAPSSTARREALLQGEQESRAARAAAQGFVSCRDPQTGRWWVFSETSGATYETTATDCTCFDATKRLIGTGLVCKHSLHVQAEERREQTEARRAFDKAEFERIFS